MGQSLRSPTFITYVLAFHLAWACWPHFLYPRVVAIGETTPGIRAQWRCVSGRRSRGARSQCGNWRSAEGQDPEL